MNVTPKISAWARSISFALMLAWGTAASAQGIIHTTPQEPIFYNVFSAGMMDFSIDITGDGTSDFILRSNDPDSTINTAFLIPLGNNALVSKDSYVANMNSGQVVGSSLDPVYSWSNVKMPISAVAVLPPRTVEEGNFVGQSSGYIGFDVFYDGAHHYGWMSISSPNGDAAIYGEVVSWAYQSSPNPPIAVGEVPEPSTIWICVLGVITLIFRKDSQR